MAGQIRLKKNEKFLDFFTGEVSTDHITAIQEAYQNMACALTEADGIDYIDPEELELLIATLMDLMQWMVKVVSHYWQSAQVLLMSIQGMCSWKTKSRHGRKVNVSNC